MGDFARIHTGVAHVGIWVSETADDYGRRYALARLASAVEQTMDRDLPHDRDTLEALDDLENAVRAPRRDHRAAQEGPRRAGSRQRREATGDAYKAICNAVAGKH